MRKGNSFLNKERRRESTLLRFYFFEGKRNSSLDEEGNQHFKGRKKAPSRIKVDSKCNNGV